MENKVATYKKIEEAFKTLGLYHTKRTRMVCKDWNRRKLLFMQENDEEGIYY